MRLLDHFVPEKGEPEKKTSISRYRIKIARLGGYLARAHDPPPGNIVMWRGLSRLTDIEMGAIVGAKIVGIPRVIGSAKSHLPRGDFWIRLRE